MNIIFLSIGGVSDLGANAVYPDLLRRFKDNGNSVYVVCQRERRSGLSTEMNVEHGINVLRVKTGNITKTNFIEKGVSTLLIGYQYRKAINKYFKNIKFDLVLYSTPPITIASTVSYLKKRDKAFSYLMLKDIFPQNALDIGLLKTVGWKGLVTKYFFAQEKKLYLLSDYIGCMSEANVRFLKDNNKYLINNNIGICPNTINPLNFQDFDKASLKDKFGLPHNKIIFVYGGNFGKPQDVNFIIKVLNSNMNNPDIHFVMCGSGTDFNMIKDYEKSIDGKNLTVIENLKKDVYDQLLQACDVGLIFLDKRFTIPNFPSRLLDYMNHSMPVFAATDSNTDLGDVITQGEFGWWCESKSVDKYSYIVNEICSNPQVIIEKGLAARAYLERYFDTNIAYENIISAYNNGN